MGLADKILKLRRSGGLSTDAVATLLGITREQAEAELRDPSLSDPAPAGGGGGGGGLSLAPNGAYGDPTQEPAYLGWFADPNDLWNLNGGDTSIFVDGSWAITDEAPGNGQPIIWVLSNAVAGWWVQTNFTYAQIQTIAKGAAPPALLTVNFGDVGFGEKRRVTTPFAGKITTFTADVQTPAQAGARIDFDVTVGHTDGSGNYTPNGSIFGAVKPYIGSGQRAANGVWAGLDNDPEAAFGYNDTIEVSIIDNGGPSPVNAKGATVRLGYTT